MTTTKLKAELKKLIEAEKDQRVLDLVRELLTRPARNAKTRSPLIKRALKAEEDLKEGRHMTLEGFDKSIGEFIQQLYSPKPKAKARA